MSGSKQTWQKDSKVFRERMGGLTEEKKARTKEQLRIEKAIQAALKEGPKTIPEIAAHIALSGNKTMWFVMALKRYGKVTEAGRAGDYFQYRLKEAQS